MSYSKQVWADAPATSSPISAARLAHIEDGISAAQDTGDSAAAALSQHESATDAHGVDGLTVSLEGKANAASVMAVVAHGSDPDVLRPTGVGSVYWIGSAQPVNALESDMWWSE